MITNYIPVRDGDRYCSPNCGFGCTHADYERACRMAARAVKHMGPGWKTVVWENAGWHWKIILPGVGCSVHKFGNRNFWSCADVEGRQFIGEGESLRGAVDDLKKSIRNMRQGCSEALKALSNDQ